MPKGRIARTSQSEKGNDKVELEREGGGKAERLTDADVLW